MADDKPRQPTMNEGLQDIASRSTIHGISNIVSAKSIFVKLVWSLAFLVCLALVIRQLVEIFTLYKSYPMKTAFKVEKNTEFPAITICNMKQYKTPELDNLHALAITAALDEYRDKVGNITILEIVDLCEKNQTHCEYYDIFRNHTRKHEKQIGYFNLFVRCDQAEYYDIDFRCNISNVWISTQYGNCYTFEPSNKLASVYGLSGAVHMVINLENDINTITLKDGVRVVVHEKGTLPLPYEEGITIKGGDEAFISNLLIKTRRLGKPHGVCESNLNFEGYKYTIKICWENVLLRLCACTNIGEESIIFRNGDLRPAKCQEELEKMECFLNTKGKFLKNPDDYCKCPVACSEHVYEMQVASSVAFDIGDHASRLELDQIAKDSCEWFYGLPYMEFQGCPYDYLFQLEKNFVKLHFYLRDPLHESREEEPLYSEIEMLADIGGSLGLFIGASVLSLGEFLEVLGICLRSLCRKRKRNKAVKAVNVVKAVNAVKAVKPDNKANGFKTNIKDLNV